MKDNVALRTRQLACLLVLLSTLGIGAAASEQHPAGFRGTPIEALLYRQAVENSATQAITKVTAPQRFDIATAGLQPAEQTTLRAAWSTPAAATQAAAIQALQSFPQQTL